MHLHRVHGLGVARALLRMGTDRFRFGAVPGLEFVKLLGTGSGETFGVRDADLHRWGMFCVWSSSDALAEFESSSPIAQAWRNSANETWVAALRPLVVKGMWSGRELFESPVRGSARAGASAGAGVGETAPGGRVAALTRARIKPAQWRAFWSSVPPVALSLQSTPGLLARVGIGEAPVGLQGTFSVWESMGAIDTFAYKSEAHRQAIRQTHATGWYSEEMFGRFAIEWSSGTFDGRQL